MRMHFRNQSKYYYTYLYFVKTLLISAFFFK